MDWVGLRIDVYLYIIDLSSSFYSWRWLLTLGFFFFENIYKHQSRFCMLSGGQSGPPNKTHVSACLAALMKAFSLHRLWLLTNLSQIGVFKRQWLWNWFSCRDNITGLRDTHRTEGSTPHIIIILKKIKIMKMWKMCIKIKIFLMFILMPNCVAKTAWGPLVIEVEPIQGQWS